MSGEKCIHLTSDWCNVAPEPPPLPLNPFDQDKTPRPTLAKRRVKVWVGEKYQCGGFNNPAKQRTCNKFCAINGKI